MPLFSSMAASRPEIPISVDTVEGLTTGKVSFMEIKTIFKGKVWFKELRGVLDTHTEHGKCHECVIQADLGNKHNRYITNFTVTRLR